MRLHPEFGKDLNDTRLLNSPTLLSVKTHRHTEQFTENIPAHVGHGLFTHCSQQIDSHEGEEEFEW